MTDWNTLMFISNDKCPECFAEGNFQNIHDSVVLYYCPNGCGYFSVDVSKDQAVIKYISSKQKISVQTSNNPEDDKT